MFVILLNKAGTWAGAEVYSFGLAQHLMRRGHSAAIVGLDDRTCDVYRSATNGQVPVLDLPSGKPYERRGVMDWLSAFRRLPADACILVKGTLHSGSAALDLAARWRYGRFLTVEQLEPPLLPPRRSRSHLGGLVPGVGLWWWRMRYAGYLRSLGPHHVITCSRSVRTRLLRDYCFPASKVSAIYNGVDFDQFRPDDEARQDMRRLWSLGSESLVFGTIRRFVHEKGLDVLIRAFARLKSTNPERDLSLVLAGEGPERPTLEALARQLGVEANVVFTGFTSQPWKACAAFDVFVMPSRVEAFGISLVEGMAAGCCVIASRVGGLVEILADDSLGWRVPADDPVALSEAMQQVVVLPAHKRKELGLSGRAYAARHFHVADQYDRVLDLLKKDAVIRPGLVAGLN